MGKHRETKRKTEPQKAQTGTLAKRELTDEERARLEAYHERAGRMKPLKFKAHDGSKHPGPITAVDLDDPLIHVKMAEALGTTDLDAQGLLFDQVIQSFAGVAVASHVNPDGFNADQLIKAANGAAALLTGIKPRDELESMLAVQMIAVHNAAMHTAKLAILTGQTFDGKRTNMNYAAKLMTLFTSQMEALKKYRTGGQQKVIVEHVNVSEGGQAVVGQVTVGGGANCRTEERPHATRAKGVSPAKWQPPGRSVECAPLRGSDASRDPLPGACHAERPLPDARRQEHRPPHPGGARSVAEGPLQARPLLR